MAAPRAPANDVFNAVEENLLQRAAAEEVLGDIDILPFIEDEPSGEFGEHRSCMRDSAAINYVAAECWKAIRIAHKPTTPVLHDLSLFPQLPIDVLLEVISYMHPIELMNLSWVNKAFRALLHAPIAASLWRSAFVEHPPLPRCPVEIPGQRWAKLLFGPLRCDECGALGTFPDYRICRSLCTDCMNMKLFKEVPEYPSSHEVNDLVVKTFRLDGSKREADSDVGRLWPADGTAVAKWYEALLKVAERSVIPEVREALADSRKTIVQARKTIVQATELLADETERWASSVVDEAYERSHDRQRRVIKSARKRLVQEGHDPSDAKSCFLWGNPFLQHIARLTSKRWNKARPHILPLVDAARRLRLERERAALITTRTSAGVAAVAQVLCTAPPATWPYNPPAYTIETFDPLRALIHDPSTAPLAKDDARLADALVGLPAFVEKWRDEKRTLLASLLPTAAEGPPDVRTLELATSVFTCLGSWVGAATVTAGRSLIGWEAAGAHLRCGSLQHYWDGRLHFAPEGAAAARELVRLVGLDPATTTAAQMDRLCGGGDGRAGEGEKRFLCAVCPVERYKKVHGRRAMRWRECVLHTIERKRLGDGDPAHGAPAWVLLTDAGVEDVRRREAPDPAPQDRAWLCAMCTAHYEGRVTLPAAMEHVRETHTIRAPVRGQHVIYFAGAERTPRVPALLSQERNVAEWRCNRCPRGKLRSLRTIAAHVSDKHKVTAPSDADWTRVELILRSTLSVTDG